MHGVLRHYTLKPKDVDEVVRRIAKGGVPIIKAIPGFAPTESSTPAAASSSPTACTKARWGPTSRPSEPRRG